MLAYEGEGRDGYTCRGQIVTCDVGVSLHSKTHPLFMKCTSALLCIATDISLFAVVVQLVCCCFSTIPICPFLIQRPFTCLHSFLLDFNKFHVISRSFLANLKLKELNFLMSTLYIGIAMVFVFSPYIRKFSSYFQFQQFNF